MKILNENDLTYSLRQKRSQTNIVQSSSSANGNPNREILCQSDNGSCYIMHRHRVKKQECITDFKKFYFNGSELCDSDLRFPFSSFQALTHGIKGMNSMQNVIKELALYAPRISLTTLLSQVGRACVCVCVCVHVFQKRKESCQVQPSQAQLNAVYFACLIGVIGGDASNGPPAHVLVRVMEWERHRYAENVALSGEHLQVSANEKKWL